MPEIDEPAEKERKKPYPSLRKLARKSDGMQRRRELKK